MTPERVLHQGVQSLAGTLGQDDAEVLLVGDLVVKLHALRTDVAALAARLELAAACRQFVPPLQPVACTSPDGRLATVWPRVPVADPASDTQPWPEAGALLAGLHRSPAPATSPLPRHGWPERMSRAAERAPAALRDLGRRLAGAARRREHPGRLLHGDWHLGQLGRWDGAWRLLDIDDAGIGDPAWDLARPAGFWACGLLADDDWRAFLDAYRTAGGPAVPASGDPWPALDLPARCAVFVAAVRAAGASEAHSADTAETLLDACRAMAQ